MKYSEVQSIASNDEDMGEFVELEAVGQGGVQPLDGYHLIIIRGMEEVSGKQQSPTIEVNSFMGTKQN